MIGTGIFSMTNTNFEIGTQAATLATNWDNVNSPRTISLVNQNFAPLAGMLNMAYFLHVLGLPIVQSAKEPEKNPRNIVIGYVLILVTYVAVGVFGAIGFSGSHFAPYFRSIMGTDLAGQIDQNCLNMFDYDSIIVFILRICIFFLVLFSYPVVNYVARSMFLKSIAPGKKIPYSVEIAMNFIMGVIPLCFALFYPNVGSILAYVGGVSGFTIIYLFSTVCHLRLLYLKAFWPELAEATEMNRMDSKRLGNDMWLKLHNIMC
jgi:sodium-coupled neutral amino acid transporter 9